MSGKWIKRKADEHVCDKPQYVDWTETVHVGDQWKCDCGQVWQVMNIWRGDQREPLQPGERPSIYWKGTNG